MVERCVRDAKATGSNPAASTKYFGTLKSASLFLSDMRDSHIGRLNFFGFYLRRFAVDSLSVSVLICANPISVFSAGLEIPIDIRPLSDTRCLHQTPLAVFCSAID